MAGMNPYAVAPPPPPSPMDTGGNRNKKHIVGGQTSNVAYAPGANLQMARSGFQQNQNQGIAPMNAMQRGFFQGQQEVAPDFSQTQVNALPQGQSLTPAQAMGNQLHNNTLGNVRAPNAPQGLGYGRSNALGVVRQHTISGNEGTDTGMTYTASPTVVAPPPPPVAPAPKTEAQIQQELATIQAIQPTTVEEALTGGMFNGVWYNTQAAIDAAKKIQPTFTVAPVQPPAPAPGQPGQGTVNVNQDIRQKYAGNWTKGTMIRAADGNTYKVVGGVTQNGVYKPIVSKPGGGTMVHPAWQGSW